MLAFFASCFHRVLSGGILEFVEAKSDSKFVSRDELSKKNSQSKQKSYYGDYSFSSTQVPLLKVRDEKDIKRSSAGFDGKISTTVRVKVTMTKKEAARLLSKCKDGGVLEFRDVARELVNLPMDRVAFVSPCPGRNNGVLDSIPEEYN
ncbi:hypothetical protein DITRI_Ditri07aG0120800 [Diplodiscus trichospermus]